MVEGLNDTELLAYLKVESSSAVLYTGGGIVPGSLLSIQQLKFLHIHPGFLWIFVALIVCSGLH